MSVGIFHVPVPTVVGVSSNGGTWLATLSANVSGAWCRVRIAANRLP